MRQSGEVKEALFHPLARETIRSFPPDVTQEIGEAILDLQWGAVLGMPLSRPMPIVGPGVAELRVRDKRGFFRVFYITRIESAIIVFHAFQKKTEETPDREIRLARARLQDMLP